MEDIPMEDELAISDTILISGLPLNATEFDIEDALIESLAAFKTLHLKRNYAGDPICIVTFFCESLCAEWRSRNIVITISGTTCEIEYIKSNENNWICNQCGGSNYESRIRCYICKIPKNIHIDDSVTVNIGTHDIGTIPTHILLVRGLSDTVSCSELFHAVKTFGSPLKVLIVYSKNTHISLGFGFVFFDSEQSATMVLNCGRLNIDGRELIVNYAHLGSFIPVSEKSTYVSFREPLGNEEGKYTYFKYWDEESYCEMVPSPDFQIFGEVDNLPTKIKRSKPRLKKSKQPVNQFEKWSAIKRIPGKLSDLEIFQSLPNSILISETYSDLNRMACLLCQRRFESVDDLTNHQQYSQMHNIKIKKFRRNLYSSLKEENEKRKQTNINKLYSQKWTKTEQPTRDGIKTDNKGNQLLRKLGWKDDEGLGPDSAGMLNPIELKRRPHKLGLGSKGKKRLKK